MQQCSTSSRYARLRSRPVLLWLLLSFGWLCLVGAGICVKAGDQVAASSELAGELAMLDCDAGAKACAAATGGQYGGSRLEIIGTFLVYGGDTLLPLALLPPLAALALGWIASILYRRLRAARSSRALALTVALPQRRIRWP
jgi:hypothetical protein